MISPSLISLGHMPDNVHIANNHHKKQNCIFQTTILHLAFLLVYIYPAPSKSLLSTKAPVFMRTGALLLILKLILKIPESGVKDIGQIAALKPDLQIRTAPSFP